MRYYTIRYKTTDRIKSISILANSPEQAKIIFSQSNSADIISCR